MFERARGFTLVELVLTMAIISIAALAIFSSLSFAFAHQADGMFRARAIALAQTYLEQIVARRYDETTPPGGVPACTVCTPSGSFSEGEARADFDDVDDYDGIDDLPPVDESGATLTAFEGFRVQVEVRYPSAAEVTALGLSASTDAKLISLLVTPPGKSAMRFDAIRANF